MEIEFNACCCHLFFLVVLSPDLNIGRFHLPSNVALFILLSGLRWKQYFLSVHQFSLALILFLKVFSSSSFGRQFNQNEW